MKTIKINYSGFWPEFDKNDNFITNILKEQYIVEIAEKPDYLFYSIFSNDFYQYDCVRIFFTGECITPDFNLCDYAMAFDWIVFGDRYIRTPLYLLYPEAYEEEDRKALAKGWLKEKDKFCSFVYSNAGADSYRMQLFDKINQYMRVSSGGGYLNNAGGPVVDKRAFEQEHLFSIACENSSYPGYSTEKLLQAFQAHTIPIYWGDPLIGKVFNEKAFINCHAYGTIDEVVERIKQLYDNETLYLEMLSEPIWNSGFTPKEQMQNTKKFLYAIIEQPVDLAKRRNNSYWGRIYEGERKKLFSLQTVWRRIRRK